VAVVVEEHLPHPAGVAALLKSRNQKKAEPNPLLKNPIVQLPKNLLPPNPLAVINPAGRNLRRSDFKHNVQVLVDGKDIVRNIVFNETSSQGSVFGMMTGQQSMVN